MNLKRSLEDEEVTDSIEIQNADQSTMSFWVPEDAGAGDTIHMIAEVQDDGPHTLKRYQRVIITVQ